MSLYKNGATALFKANMRKLKAKICAILPKEELPYLGKFMFKMTSGIDIGINSKQKVALKCF